MKILLYGGTFDPPHNGHMNNLKAATAAVDPDLVVVMPAGVPPHKAASGTPALMRYRMCRCFEELFTGDDAPKMELSRWEIDRAEQGHSNYTVDTLQMLAQTHSGARLYLTIGSDMLLTFTQWRRWEEILRICTLVAVSREEGDLPELKQAAEELEQAGGKILFAPAKAIEMASKDFRRGEAPMEALPLSVQAFVKEHHLYGR